MIRRLALAAAFAIAPPAAAQSWKIEPIPAQADNSAIPLDTGMGAQRTTSGDWKDAFVHWLDMNDFLRGKP